MEKELSRDGFSSKGHPPMRNKHTLAQPKVNQIYTSLLSLDYSHPPIGAHMIS